MFSLPGIGSEDVVFSVEVGGLSEDEVESSTGSLDGDPPGSLDDCSMELVVPVDGVGLSESFDKLLVELESIASASIIKNGDELIGIVKAELTKRIITK